MDPTPTSVLKVLHHKGPCRSIRLVPKYGSRRDRISVAVDRLEKKALVKRKNTDDRRIRLAELTAKGRARITRIFRSTKLRWKRPPASSQKRNGWSCCGSLETGKGTS